MKNTVLVQGNFDVLHPGHIRLLNFAKECGNKLTVAVNSDASMTVKSRVSERHRLEMVQSLECVSNAFLTDSPPADVVRKYKPDIVVKGKEFEDRPNDELDVLSQYGGKLIFGSGEFESNAEQFIKRNRPIDRSFEYSEATSYAQRHEIQFQEIENCLNRVKQVRALVIGEVIVDEYVQGTAVGLSQEDPTIVMTPSKKETFLGGAAITAGHIKSIGAQKVHLISVLGNDEAASYTQKNIQDYELEPHFFTDESRPTPLKTRYRASSKTLLRVNQVRQHKISKSLQQDIFSTVESLIHDVDLVVFSDFNYGVLPQKLVDQITQLCQQQHIKVVADSQTSSQVGDISRYRNMDLITPTEKEVRVALNNPDDGLVILAKKLSEKSNPKNVVITLAEEGIFIHKPGDNSQQWENDRLPAINKNAVDPAGAGDCFLAASALALTAGATSWQACYLGSIASACQVGSVGNTPLELTTLKKAVMDSFN